MVKFRIDPEYLEDADIKSVSELSRRVGVSQVSMSNYMNGTQCPRDDELIKIADVLDIPVGALFTDYKET